MLTCYMNLNKANDLEILPRARIVSFELEHGLGNNDILALGFSG